LILEATVEHVNRHLTALGLAAAIALCPPAFAASSDSSLSQVETTELKLLRALVDQGVLTLEKAKEILRKNGIDPSRLDPAPAPAAAAPTAPPVPTAGALPVAPATPAPPASLIDDSTRQQLLQEVREEVRAQSRAQDRAMPTAVPEWAKRITIGGDVRFRIRSDRFADRPSTQLADAGHSWYQIPGAAAIDGQGPYDRMQILAHLDAAVKIDPRLQAEVRVTTAGGNDSTASPVYFDTELGRYARPFSAAVTLAFLDWRPWSPVDVVVGRMRNPYFVSDLVFAPDFRLDGLALGFTLRPSSQGWGGFATFGAHPLQTSQRGPFNPAGEQGLFAGQLGIDWIDADDTMVRVDAAFFDFAGLQGHPDPATPFDNTLYDSTAPLFRQFGNTMFDLHDIVLHDPASTTPRAPPLYAYASQFRVLDIGTQIELARFDPVRVGVQLDWVRNTGFRAAQIRDRLGAAIDNLPYVLVNGNRVTNIDRPRVNGYLAHFRVGAASLSHPGDWQAFAGVRYLERDAVPDAFTSADYRLGGTDNAATYIGTSYALSGRASLGLRYIAARSIDSGPRFAVDTWTLDVLGHF